MFTFTSSRAVVTGSVGPKYETLLGELSGNYTAVTRLAIERQAAVLGLSPDKLYYTVGTSRFARFGTSTPVMGDVFVRDGELFGLTLSLGFARAALGTTDRFQLQVGHKGTRERGDELRTEFEALVCRCFGIELKPVEQRSERVRSFLDEERTPTDAPAPGELVAAKVLCNSTSRVLAQAIKASGGLLVRDLAKQVNPDDTDEISTAQGLLIDAAVVEQETVVVCRKTNASIMRYRTQAGAQAIDGAELKCGCGRDLKDERREDAVAITQLGRQLVDKSRWMLMRLIEALQSIGVELDHVFVEQLDGGDEMDCLAVISGDLVLFELKDKEFSLGHAYSLAAKVGILRPDMAVIVTTDKVGNDARDHFRRARLASERERRPGRTSSNVEPVYIEGLDDLEPELEAIATQLATEDAVSFFEEPFLFASLHPRVLLSSPTNGIVGGPLQSDSGPDQVAR
jgi:hypothetical protein